MKVLRHSVIARVLLAGWLVLSLVVAGELGANVQWHDHVHGDDHHHHHHADDSEHVCAAKMLAGGLVELADPNVDSCLSLLPVCAEHPTVESRVADRLDVSLPPSCGPPVDRASFL